MASPENDGWRLERWPILMDWVVDESLYYWPELPEVIEPEGLGNRTHELWHKALSRDAYRYGSFLLKHPDAWMHYRASNIWHLESMHIPEDFIDVDAPEGTITLSEAESQCHQWRMAARRKLAWLGVRFAAKVASHDRKFFEALARITKELPLGGPPPPEIDPESGACREWLRCHQQEGDVVNAIYHFAGRDATCRIDYGELCQTPTAKKIVTFLESNGIKASEPDVRKIAKKFGLPLAPGAPGRPKSTHR